MEGHVIILGYEDVMPSQGRFLPFGFSLRVVTIIFDISQPPGEDQKNRKMETKKKRKEIEGPYKAKNG